MSEYFDLVKTLGYLWRIGGICPLCENYERVTIDGTIDCKIYGTGRKGALRCKYFKPIETTGKKEGTENDVRG